MSPPFIVDGKTAVAEASCVEWTRVPGEGPFYGLSVWDDVMVTYSDWGLRRVATYSVRSGAVAVLAADLSRPGAAVVSHPADVQGARHLFGSHDARLRHSDVK